MDYVPAIITPVLNQPWNNNFQMYTQDALTSMFRGIAKNNVFWRDNTNPQGHGPFESPYQCMEHYNWLRNVMQGTPGDATTPAINPVIKVDFFNKKRIRDEAAK